MTDYAEFLCALAIGFIVGGFFFAGLWWTITKIPNSSFPFLLILTSLTIRVSVVMLCFYFTSSFHSAGYWQRFLSCILGFSVARILMTKLLSLKQETPHASYSR